MLIVGAGALGTLFAAEAARQRIPTTLLVRTLEGLRLNSRSEASITVSVDPALKLGGNPRSSSFSVDKIRVATANQLSGSSFDVVLLACKHFDLESCSRALQTFQIQSKVCVTLSNGLGCAEEVAKGGYDSCEEVLSAVTYAGARRGSKPLEVERTGFAETIVQEPKHASASAMLKSAVPQLRFVTKAELDKVIWKKLLANCCINPLTAVLNVPNGQIPKLASPLLQSLCDEFIQTCPVELNFDEGSAIGFIERVCANTAPNTSSMLTDCLQKRRTEIEALNGALIRFVQSAAHLPTHQTMYHLVKAIEKRNGVSSS